MKHVLILWVFFIATILYADTSRHDKFRGDQLNIGNIQVIANELSSTSGAVTITPATSLIINDSSIGTAGDVLTSTDTIGTSAWSTPAAGATRELDNLQNVQINDSLLFDSAFTHDVGDLTNPAATIHAQDFQIFTTGPDLVMSMSGGAGALTPAGTSTNAIIECNTDNLSGPCAFFTTNNGDADAAPTASMEVGTGNKTAGTGDSGDHITRVGTSAGGARGSIIHLDGTEGTSGECWVSTGTGGEGNWDTCPLGGGGANTELDNLGIVAINSDLDPGTTNTRDLGNNSAHWKRLHVNTIQLVKSGTLFGFIDADTSVVMPSGKTVNVALINSTASADHGVAVHTINTSSATVDSGDVFIETGNQTVNSVVTRKSGDIEYKTGNVTGANNLGGSGGIKYETGTVAGSGARGSIDFLDGTEGTSGECWVSTGTLGEGNWETCPGATVEFITSTSSTKTIGSPLDTGDWALMTGNSVNLTVGSWLCTGAIELTFATSAPSVTKLVSSWSTVNGNDTSSFPTAVTTDAGQGLSTRSLLSETITTLNEAIMPVQPVRITLASNDEIFLNIQVSFTAAGTAATLQTDIYCERL